MCDPCCQLVWTLSLRKQHFDQRIHVHVGLLINFPCVRRNVSKHLRPLNSSSTNLAPNLIFLEPPLSVR